MNFVNVGILFKAFIPPSLCKCLKVFNQKSLTPILEFIEYIKVKYLLTERGEPTELSEMKMYELQQRKIEKKDQKTSVTPVSAVPSANTQEENSNNFLTSLLSLICGTVCKDTPLAEYIPAPQQNTSLNSVFSELKLLGFSKDICRSMVAMLDLDRSGKLGYKEFKNLWQSIIQWKNIWLVHDTDKSGSFSGFELREALNSAGYRLNNRVLSILMHRYGNKLGQIEFDDFMMCSIKLKTMMDIFNKKDAAESNTATFSMEEWLENTLYT